MPKQLIVYLSVMAIRTMAEPLVKPKSDSEIGSDWRERVSLLVFVLCYMISAAAGGVCLYKNTNNPWSAFTGGLVFISLGFAGRAACLRQMGPSYTQNMIPHRRATLVTSGPYKLIRHPLYSLYALEMLGIMTVCFNWVSLLMLTAVLLNSWYRAGREEGLLQERYGQAYHEYRRKTRRFIPFIY